MKAPSIQKEGIPSGLPVTLGFYSAKQGVTQIHMLTRYGTNADFIGSFDGHVLSEQ
jgi:hypothetical protein